MPILVLSVFSDKIRTVKCLAQNNKGLDGVYPLSFFDYILYIGTGTT